MQVDSGDGTARESADASPAPVQPFITPSPALINLSRVIVMPRRLPPAGCLPERPTKILRQTRREMWSLPRNERWRNAAFTSMKSTACMDRT